MKRRIVSKYLLLAVLLSATATQVFAQSVDFGSLLRKAIPEADRFSQVAQNASYKSKNLTQAIFPAYKGSEQIGVAFYAAPNGYSGRLHTLTVIDMKGTIRKVSVFSHTETPAYVGALDNGTYQRQFEGISLLDKMALL
ncbi:MAG: hypothetical protein Q8O15_09815, partial [Rectinemataceae bacterium]|nr:hypothetical protein [Rectinemataceae bacterium]